MTSQNLQQFSPAPLELLSVGKSRVLNQNSKMMVIRTYSYCAFGSFLCQFPLLNPLVVCFVHSLKKTTFFQLQEAPSEHISVAVMQTPKQSNLSERQTLRRTEKKNLYFTLGWPQENKCFLSMFTTRMYSVQRAWKEAPIPLYSNKN